MSDYKETNKAIEKLARIGAVAVQVAADFDTAAKAVEELSKVAMEFPPYIKEETK